MQSMAVKVEVVPSWTERGSWKTFSQEEDRWTGHSEWRVGEAAGTLEDGEVVRYKIGKTRYRTRGMVTELSG